jgi:hypothetical protein
MARFGSPLFYFLIYFDGMQTDETACNTGELSRLPKLSSKRIIPTRLQ